MSRPRSSLALSAKERLAFALDVDSWAEAERLTALLGESVGVFKVGLELFTRAGPSAVADLAQRGHRVFLDLKLHDIPATVGRATAVARALGAKYLTVHASSGREGLRAAVDAARGSELTLLGVTMLTSASDATLAEIGMQGPMGDAVVRLARLAVDAGVPGLVCSAIECELLRAELGPEVLLVTPGVRLSGDAAGDQKRVATPAQAIASGADVLVVGRPIRDAADPAAAAARVLRDIEQALR